MVVASSSGRSQPMTRLRSRIGTEPSTLTEPSGCGRTPWTVDIVLVGDVADDFLEDVLERDQALHLAVLVDHQRDVRLALEEGVELVGEAGRVGHEPRLLGDRADIDLRRRRRPAVFIARRRSLAWTMPTMFSGSSSQIGTRV